MRASLPSPLSKASVGPPCCHVQHVCCLWKQVKHHSSAYKQPTEALRSRNLDQAETQLFSNLNPRTLKHEPGSVWGSALLVSGTTVGAGILVMQGIQWLVAATRLLKGAGWRGGIAAGQFQSGTGGCGSSSLDELHILTTVLSQESAARLSLRAALTPHQHTHPPQLGPEEAVGVGLHCSLEPFHLHTPKQCQASPWHLSGHEHCSVLHPMQ